MIIRYPKTPDPGGQGNEKTATSPEAVVKEDACRCKETAKMSPRQLIGLMVSDLAFWKKMKKG